MRKSFLNYKKLDIIIQSILIVSLYYSYSLTQGNISNLDREFYEIINNIIITIYILYHSISLLFFKKKFSKYGFFKFRKVYSIYVLINLTSILLFIIWHYIFNLEINDFTSLIQIFLWIEMYISLLVPIMFCLFSLFELSWGIVDKDKLDIVVENKEVEKIINPIYVKSLENHFLLYDKDCPFCQWYSNLFVKLKILPEQSRVAYQDIDREKYNTVNYYLAQNKIALLNTKTNTVTYGIDSIAVILNIPFPFVSYFLEIKPIHWLLEKLYSFISMNRKVFMPVSCNVAGSCNPTRSWLWRIVLVIFCLLPLKQILGHFLQADVFYWFNDIAYEYASYYFIFLFAIQLASCFIFEEKNYYDYIGQLSFITFLGTIALSLFSFLNNLLNHFKIDDKYFGIIEIVIVLAWMFYLHNKRLGILVLNKKLNYTWFAFNTIFIIFLKLYLET